LFRNRDRFSGPRDLEVITAPAKINDTLVVRVLENAHEHTIAQALGVTSEQLPRAHAYFAGANGFVADHELIDGAANEIECLAARQPLAA
jgi:hypothetical protein